jgi:hypothetical protein
LPSQVPSRPQVETALFGQTSAVRGGSPAATKLQVPGAEVVLHDLQLSVHAVLQQSPSTQNPVVQSALHAHAAPLALLTEPSRPQPPASTPALPPSFFGVGPGEDE